MKLDRVSNLNRISKHPHSEGCECLFFKTKIKGKIVGIKAFRYKSNALESMEAQITLSKHGLAPKVLSRKLFRGRHQYCNGKIIHCYMTQVVRTSTPGQIDYLWATREELRKQLNLLGMAGDLHWGNVGYVPQRKNGITTWKMILIDCGPCSRNFFKSS